MRRLIAILSLLIPLARPAAADAWTNWAWRAGIGFPGYTRSEALTNFPAFIQLGAHVSNFSYAAFSRTNGADLRFFGDDGGQELAYEIEKWNTNGLSSFWVRLPVLSNASDSVWACWLNQGSNAMFCSYRAAEPMGGFRQASGTVMVVR